jgi:hypothetical protein
MSVALDNDLDGRASTYNYPNNDLAARKIMATFYRWRVIIAPLAYIVRTGAHYMLY